MRTGVFSNEEIAKRVNERFVCAWVNKKPTVKFVDGLYDRVKPIDIQRLPLGAGTDNITSIFATADGIVLNAIPGHLDLPSFKSELEFSLTLDARLKDSGKRAEVYQEAHRAQMKAYPVVPNPRRVIPELAVAAEAHQMLSKSEIPRIEEISFTHFDKLVKPNRGCMLVESPRKR